MAIIDRIKFDGLRTRDWLIYKYPGDSFVMGSQLIVGEGQVAVFVKGGQALDYFTAGTYTLSTDNIPLLKHIVNLPYGGNTPFTAEVFFINKSVKLDMHWGTIDPIQVIDPKYKIKLRVRGFGQFGVRVTDYRVFLTELIGVLGAGSLVQFEKITDYFKGVLVTKVKTIIADFIIKGGVSALEMSAHLEEISDYGMERISPEFQRFGLSVINFFVQSINFPDEDFDAVNAILQDKAAFDIMGEARYVSKRSFDVMEGAAQNPSAGIVSSGLGLGMGVALGNTMGNLTTNLMRTQIFPANANEVCFKCNTPIIPGSTFCGNCGQKQITVPPVICTKCSTVIPPGQKFCNACGNAAENSQLCSSCGFKNPQPTKFCGNCGKLLAGGDKINE